MVRLDDEEDREAAAPPPPKRGNKTRLAIIAAIVLILVGAAVAATLLLTYRGSETAGKDATADADKNPHAALPQVPLYLDLDLPFVVNLNEENEIHFLQITVSVMAYDPAKIEKIKGQMPLVRHHLVMLFSNQTFADIRSREGKLKLQAQARDVLREALTAATGDPLIEALYLTSVVAQ